MINVRGIAVTTSLLSALAAVPLFPPSAAAAQVCSQWDLTGEWKLGQGHDRGNRYIVHLNITQTGETLTGSASYIGTYPNGAENEYDQDVADKIEGSISGNTFTVIAHWRSGTVGEYRGSISTQGFIEGDTFDHTNRGFTAHWTSLQQATCIATGPTPEATAFCQGYADTAVAQVAKSQQMQCGYGGPRWDANRKAHFDWCMTFDGAEGPPTTEALYRIQGLKDCAAKVEANTQNGILQKPGSRGDIFKKLSPPASGQ
jgi:hypothetical protein